MNDKKTKTIFIVLFIAFAVSSIIGATTGLIFLPFIVWIIFFVMIIKVGIKNTIGAKEKLKQVRPLTIAQANRISGVNPADISILLVYLESRRKK